MTTSSSPELRDAEFSSTDSSADVAPVRFSHTTEEEPVDYREFAPHGSDSTHSTDPTGTLRTPFSAPTRAS
ncbi:hypothetical protein [Saccharomonospora saliphila]|uniref:hypothetical protein n=1 Tax=Saccharomonospora saliphila TaxID=369829 RepID=UPI0012FBAE28|nr:hypothetical protein [Saccharomonospora saliphila]